MSTIRASLFALFCVFVIALFCRQAHQRPIPAPDSPVSERTVTYRVTAFCKESCCCGQFADGITASGARAEGKLIAAPKSIPFHTWIDIPGYGYAEVLDRGSAIKGNRLDVFFDDTPTKTGHQRALEWGVKYIEINIDNLQQ